MKVLKIIEENFWILLVFSLIFGLLIPNAGKFLNFLVIPFLLIVLFLTYLKIDFIEVIFHIKRPLFIFYVVFMFLFVVPSFMYILFYFLNPEISLGILLLCAMPPGIAVPVFTNAVKGNTALSVAVSLISYILVPFTVLFLFFFFAHKTINIDIWSLAKSMLLINFTPLIAAQLLRKINKMFVYMIEKYISTINIFLISLIAYAVIASESNEIMAKPINTIYDVLLLYMLFILLHLFGYFTAFWRNKQDKVALSVAKTYMNNALAIGLAFAFFNPKMAFLMVLSEIPWNSTLGIFKLILKYVR